MNYVLFDGNSRNSLLPFTFTRPVAEIRCGILTLREKWERHLGATTSTVTEDYLSDKWPLVELEENILINASFCPTPELVKQILSLKEGEAIFDKEEVVAFFSTEGSVVNFDQLKKIPLEGEPFRIRNTWDIFRLNGVAIEADFELLTRKRKGASISSTNQIRGEEHIFIEEGAVVENAIINADKGPVYIASGAEVMEGSIIRGPFALGEGAIVKMGAKIYGPTTVGPFSKAGGEIQNCVIFGYSNKSHDGYLGNSVVGEWCNLGADSNTSNLKNNYAEVRLWNYETRGFARTGLQFCGLMMGDHSKSGINTMFNTGTVVGVSANIFGSGFPRNFIPSFSWGGSAGMVTFKTEKAFEVAEKVMERKGLPFSDQDRAILEHVFELTREYRRD